ncbi:galactosylceramide sulfotransferase-like [Ptychodera flava]|uniref:galactosylceramide sulfotransferase-like n=1 Tax=Ptychodera flava TaxID=63121 RepID=UPI00396A525A
MGTLRQFQSSDYDGASLKLRNDPVSDSNEVKKSRGRSCCCCCSLTWKKLVFLILCSVTVVYLIFIGPSINATRQPLLTLCFSVERIIYIKTHKTASTTLSSIIQRWGYLNGVNFALPINGHTFSPTVRFNQMMVKPVPSRHYSILTNHARYYRPEMEKVVPNALYITILRDPTAQLESAFGYYKMAQQLRLDKYKNPFAKFMDDPQKYLTSRRDFHLWTQMRNGQIFDLGLDHRFHDNDTVVDAKIEALSKEFRMVLITEYFDESLLVLKNILCWDMDNILYLSNSIRGRTLHYRMSGDLIKKTRDWNKADLKLYEHFNSSLWTKIRDYGPNFEKDLAKFRRELELVKQRCIVPNRYRAITDFREERLVLKRGAGSFCKYLWFGDMEYTELIREKQRRQPWLPPQFSHRQSRPVPANLTRPSSGVVFVWVWVIVLCLLALCFMSCCLAAVCDRRSGDDYLDCYDDDDEASYDLNDEIDRELELRRRYMALLQNARHYDHSLPDSKLSCRPDSENGIHLDKKYDYDFY